MARLEQHHPLPSRAISRARLGATHLSDSLFAVNNEASPLTANEWNNRGGDSKYCAPFSARIDGENMSQKRGLDAVMGRPGQAHEADVIMCQLYLT